MRLSRTRLRATHNASWMDRLASSKIILLPPRTKMVTALETAVPSTTSMRSRVVPNTSSFTDSAVPSLSGDSSSKRGTMRAPVAMASSSISTPPTHLTAGSPCCISRWFASSSKPHWQMMSVAPESLHFWTMSTKYFCSVARRFSNFSTVSMSTLCLVLGFGGSKGQVRMAILTSFSSLGIWGWLKSLSSTMPYTSWVSSNLPPTFPSTFMRSRFTSFLSRSATASTALTHISACSLLQRPTIFEESVVMQVRMRGSRSFWLKSKLSAIFSRLACATRHAIS
mmetsp:Transcript_1607/g.4736  ORF Transcript_1607/g.4736 Transcript_1607/m.4736 type:complete len:282 (+) Transcript_1607:669-1514(+)